MEKERDNLSQQNLDKIIGTTVLMESKYENENITAIGTGFFIEPDKIVTNVHVLAGATTVTPKSIDTEAVYTVEGITAFDDINDLAILKIVEEGTPFPIGDSKKVRKGEHVCVIGYPEKKVSTVEGSVHSIRNSGKHLWLNFKLSEGNSGGPVLNAKGEVIAIATAASMSFDNSTTDKNRTISSKVLKLLLKKIGGVEPLDVWQRRSRIRAYIKAYKGDETREQGEYKEAIDHYDFALKLNPYLENIYNNRAAAKILVGRYDEAYTDLLTALRLNPERFNFTGIGVFLAWKWEIVKIFSFRLSIKFIRNVLGKGGWFALRGVVKFRLAKARVEQGNIMEAGNLYRAGIDNFTEAINQEPKRGKFYNTRGWMKYFLGKLETEQENEKEAQRLYHEAISDADEALHLKAKNAKYKAAYHHTRGAAKASLNDHNAAIEDFDESIRLRPKKALYYHDRGLSKQALGQHEAAEVDFDKAKELDPEIEK